MTSTRPAPASVDPTPQPVVESHPHRYAATRVACAYVITGLLWVVLTDHALMTETGELTGTGFLLSISKGAVFVLLSAVLVFWLCRREFLASARASTLLRAVVNQTTDAVFVKDREGRYLLANASAARFLGRRVEEVLGRDDRELFDEADAKRLMAKDQAIMASGEVITEEETLTTTGVSRTYYATKAPYRNDSGAVTGLIGIARDFTERKASEDALRVSEARFRELADTIPQIVWTAGPNGDVTSVNAKGTDYAGLEVGDLTGWQWERVIHPDDLDNVKTEWAQTLMDGVPRPFDVRIRRADGVYRWHIGRQRPIRDAAGGIASWVGTFTDIDDLKGVETALRESDARLREAQRIASMGSWTWEPPTNRVWWSDAEVALFGLEPKTSPPTFEEFLSLLHPDDRPVAIARVDAMLAGANEFANDLRVIRPDGTEIWIYSRAFATRDAQGTLIRVEGTDQDITARKKGEAEVREARRMLRLVLDAVPHAIFWKDQNGRHLGCNTLLAHALGFASSEEVIGRTNFDLPSVTPEEAEFYTQKDREVIASGVPQLGINETLTLPGGLTINLETYKLPLVDDDGRAIGVVGMWQDVTVRKQAESRLQESQKLLQAAIEVASLGVIVIDYTRQTAELSTHAAAQFGLPAATPVSRTELHARFHPDDLATLETLTTIALDPTGTGWFSLEHRVIRPDGTTRWLNVRKQVSFVGGQPHQAVVVTADVTDRRLAEEALRASEEQYRLMFEANPHAMWVYDVESFRFLAVNDAAVQTYGYSRDQFLSMTIRDIRPAEDVPQLELAVARTTLGNIQSSQWRHRRKDGTVFNVEVTSHDLSNQNRHSRLVLALDITERLQAEQARDALLARLQLHIDRMPIAYILFDAEFRYAGWNPAAEKIFGYTQDQILGQSLQILIHPDDCGQIDAMRQRLRSGNMAQNVNRNVTKDGRVITCEWHNTPLYNPNGVFLGVLSMALDITDRVEAERALKSSERRLRLALEAAGAVAFVWDIKNDSVTRYFSVEPALPVTAETLGTLAEVCSRVHPDDLVRFQARLTECLTAGTEYRNVYRVVRPDGTTACLEEYGYLDRAADGAPLQLTGMSIDMTERVAAAEALQASEERFQEAARVAGFGVFEHNHRTDSLYWSARLREIYGYPPDGPVELAAYLNMIHPADRDQIADAVRRAHDPNGDGRFDVLHRLIRPADGRIVWLATQSQTRYEGDESNRRLLRTVGATVDVTDVHEAAAALQQSEERYRLLVDTLPTSVHVIDNGRLTFCNRACIELFGAKSADELLGKTPMELVHPDSHKQVLERIETIASTLERVPNVIVRIMRLDGQLRTVLAVASPIPGGTNGKTHIVCLNDITEQERSSALLRSVLGSVGDAILTIDIRGTITTVNQSTARLFGYTEAEILGNNVSMLMPEKQRKEHDTYIANYLRTGIARVIGVVRDVECRRKDGTTFPAELTVSEFLRDGERQFTGVLRDISERRRLEEQFRQAQKMEAVGRLAGGVAHDFNNLLTVINGYTDMLLTGLPVGDPSRESLAAILDAGERAARLTQQLLAFSRKSVVEPQLVDLNELVAESSKLLRRLIGEDIVLAVLADHAPVQVMIDPGQLEQVLMNLVVNARDAMPTGGRLTIETHAVVIADGAEAERSYIELPPGRYATLRVTDTGCGMSDEIRNNIFEPFFTTKEVGKGTGLGLAVVHGVVKQAGGSVGVESTIGVGTTFTVLLPAASRPIADSSSGITRVAPRGTETILLVEDEDAVRRLVKFALESQGYTVLPAAHGNEALDILSKQSNRIDLLVTDVIMPRMNGRELAETARMTQPGLRVLYMSGYTDDALDRHGLQGGDHFIQKPFAPLVLARKVREVLDQRD